MEGLVSLIVPVYNAGKDLSLCLESLAAQTYAPLEVILVDDGSTDGSGRICEEMAAKDRRFHVIHQENRGMSGARNAGLSRAGGQWICFADADDALHPRSVEWMVAAARKGYDLVETGYQSGNPGESPCFKDADAKEIKMEIHSSAQCIREMFSSVETDVVRQAAVWNKLYSRRLLHGLQFGPFFASEDILFNLEVFRRLTQVACLRVETYWYCQRAGSSSRRASQLITVRCYREMLDRLPDGEEGRGSLLRKTYRKMLTTRYHLRGTADEPAAKTLYREMLKGTFREYLLRKDIPWKEKGMFCFLWLFPGAMRLAMHRRGN